LSLLELEKEPDVIANLIKSVIDIQSSVDQPSEFYFVCEITTQIQKNVRYVADANFSIAVDPSTKGAMTTDRMVSLIEQYPFSYTELRERVKRERPKAKQPLVDRIIREHDIKNNPKMSAYSFRTKTHKDHFEKTKALKKDITSIYNENAVRFIISLIPIND
jgi:predicted transcriptional regulator